MPSTPRIAICSNPPDTTRRYATCSPQEKAAIRIFVNADWARYEIGTSKPNYLSERVSSLGRWTPPPSLLASRKVVIQRSPFLIVIARITMPYLLLLSAKSSALLPNPDHASPCIEP